MKPAVRLLTCLAMPSRVDFAASSRAEELTLNVTV